VLALQRCLDTVLQGLAIDRFAQLQAVKSIMEASAEYREACALVQPLFEQLLSLQAQVESEQLARQQAESDLVNAVRRAEEKALAAAKRTFLSSSLRAVSRLGRVAGSAS
jgi:hypothetical protein